jgi:uncharacterized protein (TIGR02145 family)
MKTFFTLSLHLLISSFLFAQAPQGIPYKAVMRNADGSVMASSAVSLSFMIHDGSATGTVVYQESHALTSNAQGLVSCVVGNGVVSQGNFANINWGGGAKFLHVMMGTTDLGTQQLLSVPFALYSDDVESRVSSSGDTLWVGHHWVIVPGISAANQTLTFTSGYGSTLLPGNTLVTNEYIPLPGCNGQETINYNNENYPLVEIDGQCWFQKNLVTTNFRNGDQIQNLNDSLLWLNTRTPGYCYQHAAIENQSVYGNLYNWYSLIDSRGICPTGWHIPNDAEWMYLENSLGVTILEQQLLNQTRGCSVNAGGKLKQNGLWLTPYSGYSNESGFSALPGGYRNAADAAFSSMQYLAIYYSLNNYNNDYVIGRMLDPWFGGPGCISRYGLSSFGGGSVRCVKDDAGMIPGCRNPDACNYNSNANFENGSCIIIGNSCNDGNANTTNDVINANCECAGTSTSGSGTGAQLLPGNATCSTQNISVTGCGGQTSLTYDGRTYDLVEIGGQCWFADNLATDQYRNGDPIPTGLSNTTWQNTTVGTYAIYNNNPANDLIYGKLYNWYTTLDTRGLCPTGWHVPTDCEWMYLENSLGMSVSDQETIEWRGTDEGGAIKATTNWTLPNTGATNESGFTALPGGYRDYGGTYYNIGSAGNWWSSTENVSSNAWFRSLNDDNSDMYRTNYPKQNGFSVRCVRD